MTQMIEHIVLLKVKSDADPTHLVTGLNSLSSIKEVLHLSAGAITKTHPSPSSLAFTHMLHARYETRQDLESYMAHPIHLALVDGDVKPVCEDVMIVDWAADIGLGGVGLPLGSLMRVCLLKLKEGSGAGEKEEALRIVGGVKDLVDGSLVNQISFGENFSAMGKGFAVASVVVYKAGVEADVGRVGPVIADKLKDLVESVLVLDYVV